MLIQQMIGCRIRVLDNITATSPPHKKNHTHKCVDIFTVRQSGLDTPSCDNVTGVGCARSFLRQPHSVSGMIPTCSPLLGFLRKPQTSVCSLPSMESCPWGHKLSSAGDSGWDSSPLAIASYSTNYNAFFPGCAMQTVSLMLNSVKPLYEKFPKLSLGTQLERGPKEQCFLMVFFFFLIKV